MSLPRARGDPPGRPYNKPSCRRGKIRRPTGPRPRSVGAVMAQFKSLATKRINDTPQYLGGSNTSAIIMSTSSGMKDL